MQVLHSVDMVLDLRPFTDDGALPAVVQAGCLESFAMNVRALCEFFLVNKVDPRIMHWTDYLTTWEPVSGRRLKKELGWASENVAHFSLSRIGPKAVVNVARAKLDVIAGEVVDLLDEFGAALDAEGHADAAYVLAHARGAQARL
jgi:hypothetical protein